MGRSANLCLTSNISYQTLKIVYLGYTKGGKRVKEIKRRYELLSPDVSRRTLATRFATMGIPYHEIKRMC